MTRFTLLLLATALLWQPAVAQEEAETERPPDSAILRALELPNVAELLRQRGVPVEEIQAAMEGAQARGVTPGEMTEVMEETDEAVEENGPIENFGAFVQSQLEAGLRGRDLAQAIRAEHARRGIGQGRMLESRRGPPEGRGQGMRGGRPDSMGPPGGRPDSMGGPGMRGRRGPPDSMRGGGPDSMGGPPANRGGGRPDSVRRGGGGDDHSARNGGQR